MQAVPLWLSVAAALALLLRRETRNPAYMILAGSTLALMLQYGLATIPEVHQVAVFLWAAAAVLLGSNLLNARRRRIA